MASQSQPYISRTEAEELLTAFDKALAQPTESPTVFHVWGIGGVGKTTLTRKLIEALPDKMRQAKVTFGRTAGTEQPIALMKQLYTQLSPYDTWLHDPFWECCDQYAETVEKLKSQPVDKKTAVDETQAQHVKTLLRLGVDVLGKAFLSERQEKLAEQVVERGTEAAVAGLSLKDDLASFLQRHPATRQQATLREHMLNPLLWHTQAFAEGLARLAQKGPVVLVFDTYEKVPKLVDTWLWKTLLGNTDLMQQPVRLVVAGRHHLRREVGWNTLHQDTNCLYERTFQRFTPEQTRDYLAQIDITEPDDVQSIYQVTKGLPYYLNWVREQKAQGQTPNFADGHQEIEQLLLKWLNPTQRKVAQLAACCLQFDSSVIRYLTEQQGLDFATAADDERNCFGWLIQQNFIESVGQLWQVDDVARDVFRKGLRQADPDLFEQIYQQLADYALRCADKEVPAAAAPPDKYENPDWRKRYADYLYYLPFSRSPDFQTLFLSHLLEARFFKLDESLQATIQAMLAEGALEDEANYLPFAIRRFLKAILPAVSYGRAVLEEVPVDYVYNQQQFGLSKTAIDTAIQHCLAHPMQFDGLAKFMALLCKAKRCPKAQQEVWLLKAQAQADALRVIGAPDFLIDLYFWKLGNAFYDADLYEHAISAFDVALDIKPDLYQALNNKGLALYDLGKYEQAISACDDALAIQPDDHNALNNKGNSLNDLGRYEQAISAFDDALVIKPDLRQALNNKGNSLANLEQYEQAISAFDDALAIQSDYYQALYNKGLALYHLEQYEQAISAFDDVLAVKSDYHNARYNKACSYSSQGDINNALVFLQQAITRNPKYCNMAKTDTDFDAIRQDPRFQALINNEP